jgi:hypothetical protein
MKMFRFILFFKYMTRQLNEISRFLLLL